MRAMLKYKTIVLRLCGGYSSAESQKSNYKCSPQPLMRGTLYNKGGEGKIMSVKASHRSVEQALRPFTWLACARMGPNTKT